MGTIGQTHGITRAPRPPRAEKIRNGTSPSSACFATSLTSAFSDVAGAPVATLLSGSVRPAARVGAAVVWVGVGVGGAEAAASPGQDGQRYFGQRPLTGNFAALGVA